MAAKCNLIVAVDKYGGFAKKGTIPWHYTKDFKWFSSKTKGYKCLVGKNTYLDMIDIIKPSNEDQDLLPGRELFVLSKDDQLQMYGNATRVEELDRFLYDNHGGRVFICGGQRLYREALSYVDTCYVTVVSKDFKCDKFFPVELLHKKFTLKKCEKDKDVNKKTSSNTKNTLYFLTYVR